VLAQRMEKTDLEELRREVPCSMVLEEAGFALDLKESTRKAMKYRRDSEIIIVIHEGKGWFDPLGDGAQARGSPEARPRNPAKTRDRPLGEP